MSTKTLSKAQELGITNAAERMVDLANQGLHPNDALFKVSSEQQLAPEFVKRLTEVYNTSRMLAHFQTASPEKRADEFPLAAASEVLARMYPQDEEPDGVKAARVKCHSTWFGPPPDFTTPLEMKKEAIAPLPLEPTHAPTNLDMLLKRARSHLASLKRSADIARTDELYRRELVLDSVVKASQHFRSMEHQPFEKVETAVLTHFGADAKPFMDAVYTACRGERFGEKRGAMADTPRVFDAETEPYCHIVEAVERARQWSKAAAEARLLTENADTFFRGLDTRMRKLAGPWRTRIPFPFSDIGKNAGVLLPTIASASIVGRALNEMGERQPGEFEQQVQQSVDPAHETALRTARTRAMLNEFMTSDPVISGYPPEQVMSAFNELSQLTPRVADQPAILRGMLARRLELGRTEPFEAEQAISAETGLKKVEEPSPAPTAYGRM
jgi:hypothetical protein